MKLSKILFDSLLSFALLTSNVWADSVNINKADASTLAKSLNGVGEKKADGIIKYRKDIGKFESAEEIMKVKGIGEKTFEKNKKDILVKDAKK